jgi:oxygen-independent coproporphyrinogen-3 oxidase
MRALYIHWPFCVSKCPYCDFNSHVREGVDTELWQNILFWDMEFEADQAARTPLESIFFGGGTPSLMPPKLVGALLKKAQLLWGFAPNIEITLEANPSSVEASKFTDLASAGINRVSLGVQSLHDEALHFLGRLHNAQEALAALETAQSVFNRVSFDLIYARPGQTLEEWQAELARALSFGTDHLSLYQLTIEPQTRFASDVRRSVFTPLDDDMSADMFELTREMTAAAGLPAYEVSNHAKVGQESRHNLTYWRYQDYAGIGPGAHGRRGGMATMRHKKPENYITASQNQRNGISETRPLGAAEQASEALLMGLRLTEGLDLMALEKRFGIEREALIDPAKLDLHRSLGLIRPANIQNPDWIGVSEAGMVVLDGLLGELVPEGLVTA